MLNMKSLSLTVHKLWPRFKFFATESQTDKLKNRLITNTMIKNGHLVKIKC